jgi:casein kinase 1
MLIHLLTPDGLTWTRNGVPKTDEAHDLLKAEKLRANPEDLCAGMPVEFEDFLLYTRGLRFEQTPDYKRWILVFEELMRSEGWSGKSDFVWPPVEEAKRKAKVCFLAGGRWLVTKEISLL